MAALKTSEMTAAEVEQLSELMGEYYYDPYGFVCDMFPWGVKGTPLERFKGPRKWQREVLTYLGYELKRRRFNGVDAVLPVCVAVASGHGIGKSALSAWIILWLMCTRYNMRGTVTANTAKQLSTRTWGEVGKWRKLSEIVEVLTRYKNSHSEMTIYNPDHKDSWRIDAFTSKKENSESFAGQHNVSSTSLYLFDEASAIDKEIFEVAQGGLTDGEPIIILFGNPTRNTGYFRDCFKENNQVRQEDGYSVDGNVITVDAMKWKTWQIDSRTVEGANLALAEGLIERYGEDSDYVRVRVKGIFPKASVDQLIPEPVIDAAMERITRDEEYRSLPVVFGLDIAGAGDDKTVLWMRQGTVARELFAELELNETEDIVDRVLDEARIYNPDTVFVDTTGVGWGTYTVLKNYVRCRGINFAEKSSDPQYLNIRAEGYHRLKDWLKCGGDIPHDDKELKDELEAIEYFEAGNGKRQLIDKKDIKRELERSPDKADALMLCCVRDVTPVNIKNKSENKEHRRGKRSRIYSESRRAG